MSEDLTEKEVLLTDDQVSYLRGLVRMSIRKQRRSVTGFRPHPGQDPAEAAGVLARFRAALKFREDAYAVLGGHPETIEETGHPAIRETRQEK